MFRHNSKKVGDKISVKVKFTKAPSNFFTVIVGKTGIIKSYQHEGRTPSLTFDVTPDMVPLSNLFVYYHQSNGEIVFNQFKLEFEEKLGNFVSVEIEIN